MILNVALCWFLAAVSISQSPEARLCDALINCTMGMRGMNCYVKSQLCCMGWRRKRQLPGVGTVGLFTVSPEGVGRATIYISLKI